MSTSGVILAPKKGIAFHLPAFLKDRLDPSRERQARLGEGETASTEAIVGETVPVGPVSRFSLDGRATCGFKRSHVRIQSVSVFWRRWCGRAIQAVEVGTWPHPV